MRGFLVKIIPIVFITLMLGCGPKQLVAERPGWINEPGDGAVGSSVMHVRGRHYQEELAIARARERIAARYGVEVSSVQTINERVVQETAFVTSEKDILLRVNKTTVKAQVRETWHDSLRDVIWVWMYPLTD